MQNKTCVVTGASSGIGYETALGLAKQGARVLLVCRDSNRAELACQKIKAEVPSAPLEIVLIELASLASVRSGAKVLLEKAPRIDVLILNAGVWAKHREITPDGYEMTFAVNHLAPFLLTRLLESALVAAAPSRVIVVSSRMHRQGKMNWNDLHGDRRFSGNFAYAQSKLANVLFTMELARRWESKRISVNCLHPGVVATDLFRNAPKPVIWIGQKIFRSPRDGAAPTLFLATSEEGQAVSGKYFDRLKEKLPAEAGRDPDSAGKLWRVSERLTGLTKSV